MITLKNILVPVDFSDSAKLAFRYAASLANEFGSKIHLLHVIPEENIHVGNLEDPLQTAKKWALESAGQLEAFVDSPYRGLPIEKHVKGGMVAETIFDFANQQEIDLIIMGARGQSGLVDSLLGGISYEVARKAPCPVLTVKPTGHGFVSV